MQLSLSEISLGSANRNRIFFAPTQNIPIFSSFLGWGRNPMPPPNGSLSRRKCPVYAYLTRPAMADTPPYLPQIASDLSGWSLFVCFSSPAVQTLNGYGKQF